MKRGNRKQRRREEVEAEDDGPDIVCEDQFEDEEEEENIHVGDGAGEDGEATMAVEGESKGEVPEGPKQVYRPGVDKLDEGEVLDYDSGAYKLYHAMNVEWPCLSFDIIEDRLGQGRTKVG